jgi:hypothetical protein
MEHGKLLASEKTATLKQLRRTPEKIGGPPPKI